MKIKTIVLGWILMAITQTATSQASFGVQGGISFFKETQFDIPSHLHNYDLVDRFSDGYYIAIITDLPIKNKFSIQGELSLIRKGRSQVKLENIQFHDPAFKNDWRLENRFEFLEIPIIGKYHFHLSQFLGMNLGAGLSVGYLVRYQSWLRENFRATSVTVDIPNDPANGITISRWDVGPILDMSFPTKTKFGNFIAGFRGSMDFKKSRTLFDLQGRPLSAGRSYNWGMTVYTGYTFNKNNFRKNKTPKNELE